MERRLNERLISPGQTLAALPERSRLIRKLQSIAHLSEEEQQALLNLPVTVKNVAADQDIVRDKDRPNQCCLLLEGFVARYKLLDGGKRQIMAFHTPGDIPDLQSLHLKVMDHSIGTLVSSKLAFIPHASIRALIRRHPILGDALWRDTLVDAAIFREWMVGLGRREAYARVAHLMCELLVRFKAVGLATDHAYELPLTQAELGDALGLSTVHVNRVLQELRRDDLILLRNRYLVIQDWDRLKEAGEFDPTYLQVEPEVAA
jgi:CRP-like cAMP-binding protein